MELRLHRIRQDCTLEPLTAETPVALPGTGEDHLWLDVSGRDSAALRDLLKELQTDPLVLDAFVNAWGVTSVDRTDRAMGIEFPVRSQWQQDASVMLGIICLPGMLVTVHWDSSGEILAEAVQQLTGVAHLREPTTAALLLHIISRLVDRVFRFAVDARGAVDSLAEKLEDTPDEVDLSEILSLRRQIGRLSKMGEDQLYCGSSLAAIDSEALQMGSLREYFRDLAGEQEHAVRTLMRLENRLRDLQQQYQSLLQARSDGRLRTLTMLSGVFLPLTLIAGIYGMNFQYMPELSWPWAYPLVLCVMLTIAGGMLLFFWKRGWFD